MSTITITIEGLEELQRKGDRLIPMINAGLVSAGVHVMGVAKRYPPKYRLTRASVYGSTFVSDRQRKKVMAMLREGGWPYRRTDGLGNGWFINNKTQLSVSVENTKDYGYYVQGSPGQSLYHKAKGWQDTDTITEITADYATYLVKQVIDNL